MPKKNNHAKAFAFSQQATPKRDCDLCPRLADFRNLARKKNPDWFNAPVPPFGDPSAALLIVGLAPGLQGANRTGRPFTGDYAGELLYATLSKFGFASGRYRAAPDDGFTLVDCAIANAVRCVPPQNKPTPAEISQCRPFLAAILDETPNVRAIVALGRIAHDSVIKIFKARAKDCPFSHGGEHWLVYEKRKILLIDSYHCSRYNTNTRVLTTEMFHKIFQRAQTVLS